MATTTKTKTSESAPKVEEQTPEPLVDLDEAPRPTVRYQGKLYELSTLDDFGIDDQQALTRDGREFFRLWSSDAELKRTQKQRLQMLLERLFNQILRAPDDVKASLKDAKRAQVVLAFTMAPLAQRTAELQAQQAADKEEEARDSSTSTS